MKLLSVDKVNDWINVDDSLLRVFSDFDGTLVEIAAAPHKIFVDGHLQGLLESVSNRHEFCLVTGRSMEDISKYIKVGNVSIYASHGAETNTESNTCAVKDNRNVIDELLTLLSLELFEFPGVYIEEKPYSIAIHYRQVIDDVDELKSTLFKIAENFGHEIKLLSGKKVVEFCLRGFDKGRAIQDFCDHHNCSNKAYRNVFIGDDITDEDGFNYVNQHGGISIRVGFNKHSAAQYYVNHVTDVHSILDKLVQ